MTAIISFIARHFERTHTLVSELVLARAEAGLKRQAAERMTEANMMGLSLAEYDDWQAAERTRERVTDHWL